MIITKYRNLSNKELLSWLESKRVSSPIIDELCSRIESMPETTNVITNVLAHIECPVCEAKLKILEDENNEIYTLKEDK